jgi:glutamine---fructose-6-phosphate transaminase (isomerizing)
MCGIIACSTELPAADFLTTGLRRLEYRGYDSAGLAVQTATGDIARFRSVGRVAGLEKAVGTWVGPALNGRGIGHTRWATHGEVTEANAHPHMDCTGRIALAHNGIIENADALRTELIAGGHVFTSAVDSEVIGHLIEDELVRCADIVDALRSTLTRVEGSWGLAVMERGTGRIAVAAQRSPLLIARGTHGDFATSDIAAIADWVDEFRVLDDGDVVELTAASQWSHPPDTGLGRALLRCPARATDTELNGYPDFMSKEIDQQPHVAAILIDGLTGGITNGELWTDVGSPSFERMQVIACGTSLIAGMVVGNVVRSLARLPVRCTVASEAAYDVAEPDTLRLAISQSGETADVLDAISVQVMGPSPLLALTNNSHSTLARRADAVVECSAGPEIGVAATKTFVCQVIAGAAVMVSALVATKKISASAAKPMVDELRRLPDRLAESLTISGLLVPEIADEVLDATGFVFMARGTGLPYAAEGALKLKELTYRWAEHYPAGELKHGPLALIDRGTPVVVVDNGDPRLVANIAEVRARGGRVITVGSPGSSVPVIRQPATGPWGPLEAVVPLQILARCVALRLGRDVDKPRNLAKSVTVA